MEGIIIALLAACGVIVALFIGTALIDLAYWWTQRKESEK